MEERTMLTIGQMSKVCGVSVKTLRHYDKIGLLKPQRIDEINGYRYYEDPQIGTMLLIGRLKRYGFSLTEIQALLTIRTAGNCCGSCTNKDSAWSGRWSIFP